jgi:NAD(P)-dependent dehydrogenase (short-subunit alcohol dehydrogenase family)
VDLGIGGRVALVTGAGQGIGAGICETLASEGALVAVNDLVDERAEAVAQRLREAGASAIAAVADVTDGEAVSAMAGSVERELGPVAILVNNAGQPHGAGYGAGAFFAPFADTERDFWERQSATITFGVLNCTRAVLPGMIERRWGRIINITSDAGRMGRPQLSIYSMAKGGVVSFSKALAQEVGRHRITVNCVSPGATETESSAEWLRDYRDQLASQFPMAQGLGRFGRPSDVAAAVAYLASVHAEWVTGQVLSVNGGRDMPD